MEGNFHPKAYGKLSLVGMKLAYSKACSPTKARSERNSFDKAKHYISGVGIRSKSSVRSGRMKGKAEYISLNF